MTRTPTPRSPAPAPDSFELEADTLRALAHPKRLMILSRLDDQGESVTEIARALHLSMPNASQHLRVLRDHGVVQAERTGQVVRYRLTNAAFHRCCALVRQLIIDEAERRDRELRAELDRAPGRRHTEGRCSPARTVTSEATHPRRTKMMQSVGLSSLKVDKVVDARGTACPGPLLEAKRAIAEVPLRGVMAVLSSDEGTVTDVPLWAKKVGHEYLGTIAEPGLWRVFVRRMK